MTPTPLCEIRVFSRTFRYAGTADVFGLWRGAGVVLDYKTGSPRDVAADLQTGAYQQALVEMQTNGDTSDMLVFDEDKHLYFLDGELLPSVTGVLQASGLIDFSRVPAAILEAARERGSAVHAACHYYNEGDLDLVDFQQTYPEYWPYLEAWIRFREDSGFQMATSFEQIGALRKLHRYAIRLKKDGKYVPEPYTNPRDFRDFTTLLQAQQIKAARKGSWIELAEVA